ncbi:hypothetical protein K450DRAFT_229778 [Umbelopsis ramanniana AG]|uniref:Phosphatidylinositol N-acetylglucosaminyltransferase subunit C n=1 Tax=Umbelopsis ramanniana AG TaxID=1314678 RepID=A0AAD5EF55_UMBRA|nr:uncharacterized protein K450DRAFT_229778 [Umbelopsis ramanniana AG]KAI8581900.1 hypothetical protein K450DRAFT_229778 [Umbelopsis ramanniana AG]
MNSKRMRLNASDGTKLPWRKLLYVKQDYPDNYVDDTFLDALQKNVNVRSYDYWTTVYESGVIAQHISSIVIFIAVFINLEQQKLATNSLIIAGTLMTSLGYIFWDYSVVQTVPSYASKRNKTAKGALFFFATLLGLSPILRTLTLKTSDDTIYALTACLFIVNMLSHDYSAGPRNIIKFPGSLSTNAAIFASVMLASRLQTNMGVFGLTAFAVEWFALFPIFRRHLQNTTQAGHTALSIIMLAASVTLFIHISKAVVFIYILGITFITFICPAWLIRIQKYKNEIHGPWDEAQPKLQPSKEKYYKHR